MGVAKGKAVAASCDRRTNLRERVRVWTGLIPKAALPRYPRRFSPFAIAL